MPHFQLITARDGHGAARPSVRVEADNWMGALAAGLAKLGVDEGVRSRIICDVQPDDAIRVTDPKSGLDLLVTPVGAAPVSRGSAWQDTSPLSSQVPAFLLDPPNPDRAAAFNTREQRGEKDVTWLLDNLNRINDAPSVADACEEALDLLLRVVPAESASVLILDPSRTRLSFAAVRGPRSEDLRGTTIPAEAGIAGLVVRSGVFLLVRDVQNEPKHFQAVDRTLGYRTRQIMASPLRNLTGVQGVLEVLNPFGEVSFAEWHEDAARAVSSELAQRLAWRRR